MAKITLGKSPKSFKSKVTFPLPGGETGSIEASYIYRTRREFGELIDELFGAQQEAQAPVDSAAPEPFSMAKTMDKTVEANADYLVRIMDGWDIDGTPFNRANAMQLCDELPGAAMALIEGYRSAITEGRLGN